MASSTEQTETPNIGQVIIPLQSAGRIGKTTILRTIMEYLTSQGREWKALDCDTEHQTLSRYHEGVAVLSVADYNGIAELLDGIVKDAVATRERGEAQPVRIIDFPSQATARFLAAAVDRFSIFELFAEVGLRLSIPLVLLDDEAANRSMGQIVRTCGDDAHYLMFRVPGLGSCEWTAASGLYGRLLAAGSPDIEIPILSHATRQAIHEAERSAGKYMPFGEVAQWLPDAEKLKVERFLYETWEQFGLDCFDLHPTQHATASVLATA